MAYAAVASLLQTVDIILDHHQHSISPQFETQIKSIHRHTCSLRSFIEASSARVYNWEETIREVTVRALLVGGSSSLEIIAICGSGGIGKTTLIHKAYFHPLIVEHFGVRTAYLVPREYTLVRLIEGLLRQMKADFSGSNSEDELIERLLDSLGGRRYLIWLDDVLSKDVMERLKRVLPDYGNGSRIIFTTRSSELAESAHHIHEMRLLDDDDSWNVLREKIFQGDPCPFQLESTGKAIARCCAGHQLSIAVVSGILAADQSEAAWEEVLENIKLASGKIDEILYLSYVYLPHHLRPCLLYMGIYPQGRVTSVSWIVRMWAAEGFVDESSGYKSLEETGEGYVEDLVRRSLVSVYERKCNCGIKSIRVHDLVQGMCQRQASIDNFSHHFSSVWRRKEIIKSSRRLSNFNNCDDFLSGVYGSTIRTLYFYSADNTKLDLRSWMRNIRLLIILHMISVKNYRLSSKVFELFHLRYLSLHLPPNILEAISNLQNLQTLII